MTHGRHVLMRIERLEALIELALRGGGGPPLPISDVAGVYAFIFGTVTPPMAVKESGGACVPAQADTAANAAIGVVSSLINPTTALVVYVGEVGGFIGLVPDATYYLDPTTPGSITNVAPSLLGQIVQVIGIAKNPTTLVVDVSETFVQL